MSAKVLTDRALAAAAHRNGKLIADIDTLKREKAEILEALRLLNSHYDDIAKSNPGFMGSLCLQNYALWNEALIASAAALNKYTSHS